MITEYRVEAVMESLLREGLRRARFFGRPIVVSSIERMSIADPVLLFRRAAALRCRTYWEKPDSDCIMVTAGCAARIEAYGANRFRDARTECERLFEQAVIDGDENAVTSGPILIGGFAFDAQRRRSVRWEGFPDGLLLLPSFIAVQSHESASLMTNVLVQPDTSMDDLLRTLESERHTFLFSALSEDRFPVRIAEQCEGTTGTQWKTLVTRAVEHVRHSNMRKVVLARDLRVTGDAPWRPDLILRSLRRPMTGGLTIFAVDTGRGCFLGMTPERLVQLCGGEVSVDCLAGTRPRGASMAVDRRFGQALLASVKDREEHQVVLEGLVNDLREVCRDITFPSRPELKKLANVQHLSTPITGRATAKSVLSFVERLHPSPAVGGSPREDAVAYIRDCEGLDRGWYAGPVGWMDTQGEGEFVVAIRSALMLDRHAYVYAGCGIVGDSDPEDEFAESCLKMRSILSSLTGDRA